MRHTIRVAALVAGALSALACAGDRLSGPGDERLVLRASTTELREGESADLQVLMDGKVVDARDVQWSSRDATTLGVEGATARGIAPGVTYAIARVGTFTDSIRLAVRFTGLGPNSVGVRLAGEVQQRTVLGGAALQFETPSTVQESMIFATAGRNSSPTDDIFAGDTALMIRARGALSLGLSTLPAFRTQAQENLSFIGDAGVLLRILDPDGSVRYYVAVTTSALEITSLTLPSAAGTVPGSVSGRVWFEAAGIRLRFPPGGGMVIEPIGNTTVNLYMEFNSQLYRVPVPRLNGTVTGTPYVGVLLGGAEARLTSAGVKMEYLVLIDPEVEVPTIHHLEVLFAQPAVGTFAIAPGTPVSGTAWFAPFIRSSPGSGAGQAGPMTDAILSSGTVTVTSYRAPTDDVYGEITGTLDAALTFPSNPAYAVNVQFAFRTPIDPLLGPPVR
jgi:hypothetical protein